MSNMSLPIPSGFQELSKLDQVRYVQALWDKISENPDDVPILESHIELAELRLQHYREDPSSASPAFEMLDQLKDRSR